MRGLGVIPITSMPLPAQFRYHIVLLSKTVDWVRLHDDYPCGQCGADMQRWVRVMHDARRIGEITFCPSCSPETGSWVQQQTRSILNPTNN